jgi:predicted Zn-dependent protease
MEVFPMKFLSTSLAALAIAFAACGTQPAQQAQPQEWGQSVSEGHKESQRIRGMSDEEEFKEGLELDAAIKDPARAKEVGITISIVKNPAVTNFVNNIGQRLALTSSRRNIQYTFQVVDSEEVNAFATLGGFVYVNKGLIKIAENEAQLAGVIAHEIAHVANRHVVEALARQAEIQGWQKGAGRVGGTLLGVFSAVVFQLPKSRSAEFEADNAGFLNVRAGGYVPDEMIRFYENVLLKMGSGGNKILSTHPDTRHRIQALQRIRRASDSTGAGDDASAYQRATSSL